MIRFGILFLLTALFFSCGGEKSVNISYGLAKPITAEVFSQNHYSTLDGSLERIGTITETHYTLTYAKIGDTLTLTRNFIADASKGYLKKSHPAELALRIPELKIAASDPSAQNVHVYSIDGNENFDSVVSNITIPDRWKRQISRLTRQIDLDRIDKLRWEVSHLLIGETPLKSNITQLLRSRGRLPLAGAEVDSVVTKEVRTIYNRKCLEYAVYMREKDPFPYFIWEQHISTVNSGKPFKEYAPQEAIYQNRYEVALDIQNGTPCLERELLLGEHGMKNPETGDSVSFQSIITKERLYSIVSAD